MMEKLLDKVFMQLAIRAPLIYSGNQDALLGIPFFDNQFAYRILTLPPHRQAATIEKTILNGDRSLKGPGYVLELFGTSSSLTG